MSTTSIVNHSLFEEQDQIPTQMGFHPFPPNLTLPPFGCQQSLKAFSALAPSSLSSVAASSANLEGTLPATTTVQKPREDLTSIFGGGGGQLLSLNRSSVNSW